DDAVLGGRLLLRQPLRGHRIGHDAILLAAATGARAGERAVDLGAGVGAAGLALALRVGGLAVTLAEIDPALCALAAGNAERNRLSDRVRAVALDVTEKAAFDAAGLSSASADRVLMNPPFNDPSHASPDARRRLAYAASADTLPRWVDAAADLSSASADRVLMNPPFNDPSHASPDARRRLAYAASADTLPRWVDAAAHLLKADGVLTLIWRADGQVQIMQALAPAFGSLAVLPVYPREGAPAIRVLVRAVKGGGAATRELAGLALNAGQGRPTAAAEAVLRGGSTLPMAEF